MFTLVAFTVVGMFLVQLFMFRSLPVSWQCAIASIPIIGVVANFALSTTIVIFTGAGMVAGIGNVLGSVILGIYLEMFKRIRRAKCSLRWRGWFIFGYPSFSVSYADVSKTMALFF
jgi:hypothetical protein